MITDAPSTRRVQGAVGWEPWGWQGSWEKRAAPGRPIWHPENLVGGFDGVLAATEPKENPHWCLLKLCRKRGWWMGEGTSGHQGTEGSVCPSFQSSQPVDVLRDCLREQTFSLPHLSLFKACLKRTSFPFLPVNRMGQGLLQK